MFYDVTRVSALPDFRLLLTFEDGSEGEFDFASNVPFSGVFAELRQPGKFAEVRVNSETGTVEWPTGADLDPIVLYTEVTGKPLGEVLVSTAVR